MVCQGLGAKVRMASPCDDTEDLGGSPVHTQSPGAVFHGHPARLAQRGRSKAPQGHRAPQRPGPTGALTHTPLTHHRPHQGPAGPLRTQPCLVYPVSFVSFQTAGGHLWLATGTPQSSSTNGTVTQNLINLPAGGNQPPGLYRRYLHTWKSLSSRISFLHRMRKAAQTYKWKCEKPSGSD